MQTHGKVFNMIKQPIIQNLHLPLFLIGLEIVSSAVDITSEPAVTQ